MACPLCGVRRPRRFCPGESRDICAPCCGAARETTISCPFDCEYLKEARKHDKPPAMDAPPAHPDIKITEEFLERNSGLVAALGRALPDAALRTQGALDRDAREALGAMIRTWRTLESGIYYQTRPVNPLATGMYDAGLAAVTAFREEEKRQLGISQTRDSDVLGVLVHLDDLAMAFDNGRPRGRAFLHLLWDFYAAAETAPEPPPASLLAP